MLIKMTHDLQKIDARDEDELPMNLQETRDNIPLNDSLRTEKL